jgi:hypothetical protein
MVDQLSHERLITFPQDQVNDRSGVPANSRYSVRLHFVQKPRFRKLDRFPAETTEAADVPHVPVDMRRLVT